MGIPARLTQAPRARYELRALNFWTAWHFAARAQADGVAARQPGWPLVARPRRQKASFTCGPPEGRNDRHGKNLSRLERDGAAAAAGPRGGSRGMWAHRKPLFRACRGAGGSGADRAGARTSRKLGRSQAPRGDFHLRRDRGQHTRVDPAIDCWYPQSSIRPCGVGAVFRRMLSRKSP